MNRLLTIAFILFALSIYAQVDPNLYPTLRKTFHEVEAFKTVAFVEQRWRLPGNSGFNESIYYVEEILKKAGFKKEVKGESDATLTYRLETRKMEKPTWEPIDASLTLDGESTPWLEFKTNRNMIAINSKSSASQGDVAEVVYIGKGGTDLDTKDVNGKIVFADGAGRGIYQKAIAKGAIGVLVFSVPEYNQPQKHTQSISFQGISFGDTTQQKWCIMLSTAAKDKLQGALQRGTTKVKVVVKTKIFQAEELTLVATVRGKSLPDERFVFSAHVQEPGANDNASGVGTLAEMARATAELVQAKKFSPERSIVFLWGDEIRSTARYIQENKERAKGIKWGLSLDMVGEDVSKTGGTFLIEKMPDPTAIWTRGEEKHSEWGGSPLSEKDLVPHYFNDFLLSRCLQQATSNGWVVKTNPFEGGSDHTPFLEAKIPGVLMWHFTDIYYHTDGDRLVNISADEMKNVGVSALAAAYLLTSANEKTTLELIAEAKTNALKRLDTEGALGVASVKAGGSAKDEQHILQVWQAFYEKALATMTDISTQGKSTKVDAAIRETTESVAKRTKEWLAKIAP